MSDDIVEYGIAVPSSHGNMGTSCKMASWVPFCKFGASICNWEKIEKTSRIIRPNSASLIYMPPGFG